MKPRSLSRHHLHLLELASLLATAGLADAFADVFGARSHGKAALVAIGAALFVCTVGHHMWLRRTDHAPPFTAPKHTAVRTDSAGGFLWRIRTEIDNTPGRLAVLAGALAAAGANIHSLEACPTTDGVVDEFVVETLRNATAERLCGALQAVGGRHTRAAPTDVLALLDAPTRALESAIRLARQPEKFSAVLGDLLDARCVTSGAAEPDTPAAWIDGADLGLRRSDGLTFLATRPGLPFTGTEISRAQTLASLADLLLHPHPVAG
jgi:hypothetical protein